MNINRQPEGIPTGGQFAASAKNESSVSLAVHPSRIAEDPDADPRLLREIGERDSSHPEYDRWVRVVVADNPGTPQDVLVTISQEEKNDTDFAMSLVHNQNSPKEVLATLTSVQSVRLRRDILSHPAADIDVARDVLEASKSWAMRTAVHAEGKGEREQRWLAEEQEFVAEAKARVAELEK